MTSVLDLAARFSSMRGQSEGGILPFGQIALGGLLRDDAERAEESVRWATI